MHDRDAAIRDYYGTPDDSFWQWQDNGESIAWNDEKTIAFADELSVLLKHMTPYGLPRFGALLMLLAATRSNWAVDGSEAGLLSGMLASLSQTDELDPARNTDLLDRVLSGLHRIRALESSLRASIEAKKALVEIVFEGQKNRVPEETAEAIVNAIRPGLMALIESVPESVSVGYGPLLVLQDLGVLADGLDRVHPDAIRFRMQTGLSDLPSTPQIDIPPEDVLPCDAARGLIEELVDTLEYKGLAQVAKHLIANSTLPRKLTESQEQELGGFSDIANRGTPDRLLLSELAQDGLTLAVRVAMNEAMYLHRETPPSTPRLRRELLIDSGVRSWGTPRVLVAAAALAMVATASRNTEIGIWRGRGDLLSSVDLMSKGGLVEHLAALEPEPHLAGALPEFAKRISDGKEPVEAVLLMPDDAYADEDFKSSIGCLDVERLYVVTLSRHGEFRLWERHLRGEKQIRRAQIDLDQMFEDTSTLIEQPDLERLPAVFRVSPFPILLPHDLDPEKSWSVGNWGALSITGDGRLMRWTETSKGGQQLSDQFPKGKLWWAAPTCTQGITNFVFGTAQKLYWYHVDLTRGEVASTQIDCGTISGATYHNNVLFCFSMHQNIVWELNPESGKVVRELEIPTILRRSTGRFFVDSWGKWHALSHNGHRGTIEELTQFELTNGTISGVWDAVGYEGPIALLCNGHLLGDESEKMRLPKRNASVSDCQIEWVSHDGLMIRGKCNHANSQANYYGKGFQIRLDSNQDFQTGYYYPPIDERLQALASPVSIRKKFRSIGVTESGQLTLVSLKGQQVSFTSRQGLPLFTPMEQQSKLAHEQDFNLSESDGIRYKVSFANWVDGSQAILDSRGLLHLKPADGNVPEISLVLAEGELTAWCSDSRTFGRTYFLADSDNYLNRAVDSRRVCSETLAKFVEGISATS